MNQKAAWTNDSMSRFFLVNQKPRAWTNDSMSRFFLVHQKHTTAPEVWL